MRHVLLCATILTSSLHGLGCDAAPAGPAAASAAPSASASSATAQPPASGSGFDESLFTGHPARSIAGQVLDAGGKPAPYVVLWVRPSKGSKASAPTEAVIDQRDKKFVPRVLAVQVGTTVVFRNSDPIHHNVYSRSRAKSFDLGTYASPETKSVTFDQPGKIDVFCAIHTNMHATIVVLETHEFAVTDEHGAFRIADLEPGSRALVVWDQTYGEHEVAIDVKEDSATIFKHTLVEAKNP